MSKVRFEQEYSQSNQYSVVPHRWPHDNHSGDYYPAAEVERLVRDVGEMITTAKYLCLDLRGHKFKLATQLENEIENVKAALAALKGE